MNKSRVEFLERLIQDDPSDPFGFYALALDLQTEQPNRAIDLHTHVLNTFPDYLPNYYQMGLLLIRQGHQDRAKEVITKGIELALVTKNFKTGAELQNLLEE
jgi:tetratricopeptide (TPR) repeat protein